MVVLPLQAKSKSLKSVDAQNCFRSSGGRLTGLGYLNFLSSKKSAYLLFN